MKLRALSLALFALTFLNLSPVAYRGFQLETVQTFLACVAGYFASKALRRSSAMPAAGGSRRV